jgi:hypothetical protein
LSTLKKKVAPGGAVDGYVHLGGRSDGAGGEEAALHAAGALETVHERIGKVVCHGDDSASGPFRDIDVRVVPREAGRQILHTRLV